MKVMGLTGGMGSGKTTVAKIFKTFGAQVIDADELARRCREPGSEGHRAIVARFHTDDRLKLRQMITQSAQAKKDLEAILHPLIRDASRLEIEKLKQRYPGAPCIIYEATLLIEAGRAEDFDLLVLVTSPLPQRIARVVERDRVGADDAHALIRSQNTDEFRRPHADFLIENDGNLPELEKKVRKVLDQMISA